MHRSGRPIDRRHTRYPHPWIRVHRESYETKCDIWDEMGHLSTTVPQVDNVRRHVVPLARANLLRPVHTARSALTRLCLDPGREVGYLVVETAPLGHQLANLALCVHDGGVIAPAEGLADSRQRQVSEFTT